MRQLPMLALCSRRVPKTDRVVCRKPIVTASGLTEAHFTRPRGGRSPEGRQGDRDGPPFRCRSRRRSPRSGRCRSLGGSFPGDTRHAHNTHKTERRRLEYKWHPLFREELLVCGERRTSKLVVLRCLRPGDEQRDCTHIPLWMFDRTGCALMQAKEEPSVSLAALVEARRLLAEADHIGDLGEARHPREKGDADARTTKGPTESAACPATEPLPADQPSADLGVAATGCPRGRDQTTRKDLARSTRAKRFRHRRRPKGHRGGGRR
jgi:hypothetical protein